MPAGRLHPYANDGQAKPDGKEHDICVDTGTGRDMIGWKFLQNFDHVIYRPSGGAAKGLKGPTKELN
jgi:hypothetical protein